MDCLKSLPKDYIEVIGLKVLLGIFAVFTLGILLVTFTVTLLYINHATLLTMVLSGWATWIAYLILFVILFAIKNKELKNKMDMILSLANKELFMNLGLFIFNNLIKVLKKIRHHKEEC